MFFKGFTLNVWSKLVFETYVKTVEKTTVLTKAIRKLIYTKFQQNSKHIILLIPCSLLTALYFNSKIVSCLCLMMLNTCYTNLCARNTWQCSGNFCTVFFLFYKSYTFNADNPLRLFISWNFVMFILAWAPTSRAILWRHFPYSLSTRQWKRTQS